MTWTPSLPFYWRWMLGLQSTVYSQQSAPKIKVVVWDCVGI